jgi:hypothetical protein
MNSNMKQRYRVFRRGWGTYYCEDLQTGKQFSLTTRDKAEAFRLVAAKNEAEVAPAFSLHLARVYWRAGDPEAASRTWQHVMDEIVKLKSGITGHRWQTAIRDKAYDLIRHRVLLEFLQNACSSVRIARWFSQCFAQSNSLLLWSSLC